MEMAKLGVSEVQNSETSETIDTKFGIGDYVGDINSNDKIQSDRPSRDVWANG